MMEVSNKDLEEKKLAFEKEKLALEEKWRRNTYLWSILSGVLSAAVAVGVALIAAGGMPGTANILEIASGPVQACRDSLRRLETLSSGVPDQTVTALSDAVRRHSDQCDDVLIGILAELRK